jgi:hypothetical protein
MVMHAPIAARRFARSTFTGWQVLDSGKAQPHPIHGATLDQIERELAVDGLHGATILVRETETLTGTTTLHSYRVRRGKWLGRYDDACRRVYAHSADKLFSMEVSSFAPVEPWRWSPGCDVVGQSNVIEGGSNAHRL